MTTTDTNPTVQTNGINDITQQEEDEERSKMRPVDIDADVREMERRKRVDAIMNSRLFREELERIIETQLRDGMGPSSLMQQISDIMGGTAGGRTATGASFRGPGCVLPINDIRGLEAVGYAKGEKILRCKLASVFRLMDLYGWSQGVDSQITARLNQDQEHFLVNPAGLLFHEMTASSLVKVDMQGNVVEQGTTNFGISLSCFSLHAAIHAARPDIKCIISVHNPSVTAVSTLKCGLLPITQESVVIGEISSHPFSGSLSDPDEKEKVARNLGPMNKVLLLTNQGAVCCGETIEEAFFNVKNTVLACETQLKLMPVGIDNLVLLSDETRKKMYENSRKPPQNSPRPDHTTALEEKLERKFRVGGAEFEALMRMLDNAGFRTGYIYRHPLIKNEPLKPKNDVELPPAVSSLGYLLEEEELYKQGLWKRLDGRRGNDRTRWLNSPNVYQKVEILETGTPDPKKITKWVADGSPTHSSTPVKIDAALQFVPKNTNPKEFKRLQQQIKDYRRADKISAGPQSHILEGVTWEEAKKMQDATVTQTGDQVVLMGAASKGIIQRDFQHNAMVYKSPYAKNPFDCITDEELDEYKKTVEKKAKGEYDTDFSESEGLSSSIKRVDGNNVQSPFSAASETEEESKDEPQVLRIQTSQAPKPSQPEVVLSDGEKAVKLLPQVSHITKPTFYRTYSHFGFPSGSYSYPNPTHYHIARLTRAPNFMTPSSTPRFNYERPRRCFYDVPLRNSGPVRPTVNIRIGDAREITLSISMQTLREFIYPFACNLHANRAIKTTSVSSQTSFVGGSCTSGFADSEDESEYEKDIMQKMHRSLVGDFEIIKDDEGLGKNIQTQTISLAEQLTKKVLEIREDLKVFDALEILKDLPFYNVFDNEFGDCCQNDIKNDNLFKHLPFFSLSNTDISTVFCGKETFTNSKDNFKNDSNFQDLVEEKQKYTDNEINKQLILNNMDFFDRYSDMKRNVDQFINPSLFSWYQFASNEFINEAEIFPYFPHESKEIIEPDKNEVKVVPGDAYFDDSLDEIEAFLKDHENFFGDPNNKQENDENKTKEAEERNFFDGIKFVGVENINCVLSETSRDEGISACSTYCSCSPENPEKSVWSLPDLEKDEKVIKMSEVIYEYIIKQCYELNDLVLFPEIIYDSCLMKVLNKLQKLYEEYCGQDFTDEEKNELRLMISANVIRKLEIDEQKFEYFDANETYEVSDKIFTISEFLSEVLDHFFDKYVPNNHGNVQSPLENKEECVKSATFQNFVLNNALHSTPQRKQKENDENIDEKKEKLKLQKSSKKYVKDESNHQVVTTFKTKQSEKSGNEKYWISISPTNDKLYQNNPKPCVSSRIINVDDIPLRPPADLLPRNHQSPGFQLSPIDEEPRRVLFPENFDESDEDIELLLKSNKLSTTRDSLLLQKHSYTVRSMSSSPENALGNTFSIPSTPVNINHTFLRSNNKNNDIQDGCDVLAGGDTDQLSSYISFDNYDETSRKIVNSNSLQFVRVEGRESVGFMQRSNVTIMRNNNIFVPGVDFDGFSNYNVTDNILPESLWIGGENIEPYVQNPKKEDGEEDGGNWMGYDTAKF